MIEFILGMLAGSLSRRTTMETTYERETNKLPTALDQRRLRDLRKSRQWNAFRAIKAGDAK